MPPKFGNYLFRNLKGHTPSSQETKTQSEALGALEEQEIILGKEDIEPDDISSSILDWSKVEGEKIVLRLKDTNGLMNGRVSVEAATLQRICPSLFSAPPASGQVLKLSLKSVVLQIQAHLNKTTQESPKAVGPDFDTPIAQVAREDEGFFKLEQSAKAASEPAKESGQDKHEIVGPMLTPADRPAFPLIREKPRTEERPSEPAALEVGLPSPATGKPKKFDPFADLPKVGPRRNADGADIAGNEARIGKFEAAEVDRPMQAGVPAPRYAETFLKPLRRIGLESLQEIFLTEDLLDAREVAKLLARFPKVTGVLIMLNDGSLAGGELPRGYNRQEALAAPALLRAAKEFNDRMRGADTSAITIFADQPLSIFGEGNVCIVIAHEGRGLLPGMRERISEVASALNALYACEGTRPNV
jgi:hypothetical protein